MLLRVNRQGRKSGDENYSATSYGFSEHRKFTPLDKVMIPYAARAGPRSRNQFRKLPLVLHYGGRKNGKFRSTLCRPYL